MNGLDALLLGLLQGLTEFLPVSSSGHLELGKAILGIYEPTLTFTIVVHGATVLSIIVVFWQEIIKLLKAPFTLQWNEDNKYIVKLLISAIPAGVIGLLFQDQIESLFTGNVLLVGIMLLITTAVLALTTVAKDKKRPIGFWDSFIIGIAQAIAIMPGISRSGMTISTGLLLGNDKEEVAKFSFIMVLIPVIGGNILDLMKYDWTATNQPVTPTVLLIGFMAAFVSGYFACKFMLKVVRKSKLSYFAIYTLIIASLAIYYGLTH